MTIELGGLLVVKRFDYGRQVVITRTTSLGLSMKDVLKQYRGFDGCGSWPEAPSLGNIILDQGLASLDQYKAVCDYFADVSRESFCDLLCLQYVRTADDAPPHPDFHFCGYDFGHYGGEWNVFSVLIHEVINGQYDQLRHYANVLNEYFLLPELADADRLKETRDALKRNGADLETEEDEEFVPIRIYIPKSRTRLEIPRD